MIRIAIIRSASSAVSKNQYNIQEIGLAKELAMMGMEVDVFLISDTGTTYTERCGVDEKVTVYWLKGIKIPGQQGYYKDLKRILELNKYDLIQALDDSQITTVLVSQYCKKRGIKFVLWQGMYENYPEKYKRLIQYVYDWTLLKILRKNTKYAIAKTSLAKSYLLSKRFVEANVIPVALEIANFEGGSNIDYRKKLGIDNDKKIFLYVGKVEKRRRPLFCLDVYSKIKSAHEDCCLVYVGMGPMEDAVKAYAEEKEINDIYFIPKIPQNELPSLYRESELFILPTRNEIFGMVLMEAMYFGTPVVTYKAAGPLDVIEDKKDGLILTDFDVIHWVEKIEENIFTEEKREQMGQVGMEKIKNAYLWPIVARRYYEEYIRIINS